MLKPGAGRPRTLRNPIKKSLSAHIRVNPHMSLRSLASNVVGDVSHETVRKSLKDMSYTKPYPTLAPMLSEIHKINRVKWAKKYKYPAKDWPKRYLLMKCRYGCLGGGLECGVREGKKESVLQRNIPQKSTFGRHFHLWEYFHSVSLGKT